LRSTSPNCQVRAPVTPLVQTISNRLLTALQLARALSGRFTVSQDRDAYGRPFSRLRYRVGNGIWRGLYLGQVDSELLLQIQNSDPLRTLGQRIQQLLDQRHRVYAELRTLAIKYGCRFCGGRIQRKR
jgi:hypothetical protein